MKPTGTTIEILGEMKVRIGIGTGGSSTTPEELARLADGIVELGFDSIWLSETLTGRGPDPLVALSWLAATNTRLKLGTTMILPGRHPIRLARELATLDRLSGGRLLVTFVPGTGASPERSAIGIPVKERAAVMDELLPVVRELVSGQTVSHLGKEFSFENVSISPRPCQDPLEFWLGGTAQASLERCGRIGDGWLPSLCPPDQAELGRRTIEEHAERMGRRISPEHFGISIGYARTELSEAAVRQMQARTRRTDIVLHVPVGLASLRRLLLSYIDAGFSKFVLRPLEAPEDWRNELEPLREAVGDLQT